MAVPSAHPVSYIGSGSLHFLCVFTASLGSLDLIPEHKVGIIHYSAPYVVHLFTDQASTANSFLTADVDYFIPAEVHYSVKASFCV